PARQKAAHRARPAPARNPHLRREQRGAVRLMCRQGGRQAIESIGRRSQPAQAPATTTPAREYVGGYFAPSTLPPSACGTHMRLRPTRRDTPEPAAVSFALKPPSIATCAER